MPAPPVPLPSATVLLVRQREDLEVLMVARSANSYFGSALVFPGGVVDAEDGAPYWQGWTHGREGLAADEIALRIAAYREMHEEAGLLLCEAAAAGPSPAQPAPGADQFIDALRRHNGRLDLGAMHPFAHWITPEMSPKRYDTHFYLCGIETEVAAVHDGAETVSAEWITPAEALRLGVTGERHILFPTKMNLRMLADSKTVADAIDAAKKRPVIAVMPKLEQRPDGPMLTIPSDAGYGVAEDRPPARPAKSPGA
jgi:8-oxo-dGTP pyrophosphatase MutT (NUDIX family)